MKAQIRHSRRHRISPALIIALAAVGATAQAQLSVNNATASYLIDFDSTVLGVSNGPWAGIGFDSGATTLGRLDSNAWAVTGWSNGALTFGGTQTTATTDYTRGATSAAVTTGGMYAFSGGNITSGVALGFQPGGSDWAPGTLTLRVKNDTVSLITGFSLDYKLWVRNDQQRANSFNFSRSPDDVSYSPEAGLDFTSTAASDALGFTLVTRTLTISNLSFAAGGFYYLRWSGADVNGSGSRDEFALDDIRLSAFTTGVAGRNVLWSPITGAWNTTELAWNDGVGPVAFQTNDTVTFDDTGLTAGATVTIQAAGVTIGNAKITNTTGTYTFTGGSINGSGSLTKSGAGKLVLSSTNSYTGGTVVNEGTVSISADDQLGATTGGVLLSAAGTLQTTGSLTLNASRALTGTGTVNIAPLTTLNIAGTANTGALTLTNSGSLLLSGATSAQIGGFNIQQPINLAATQPILLGGSIVTTNTTGTLVIAAPLGLGTALRVFNIADGSAAIDASITGNISATSAGGRIHKLGDGTLELLGDDSGLLGGVRLGTAGATPVNGGTLIVNSATSLGPGGVGTSGQFQFNAGILRATAAIQFPSTLALSIGGSSPLPTTFAGSDVEFLGAASLFLTGAAPHILIADSNVRFASAITGSTAGLTVRGIGSLTLAAGGTFTGDLAVESGKLYITGNVAGALPVDNRPAITVTNGGLLGGSVSGSDSLGGLTALGSPGTPGTISPGTVADSTAILTVTSFALLTDGFLALEIAGLADHDQLAVNGAVNLGGGLSLSLINGYAPALGDSFTVILNDASEPIAGTFTDKAENSIFAVGSSFFRINYAAGDGNDVVLTAVVPEPGTAALLLGGLGLLGIRRRKS